MLKRLDPDEADSKDYASGRIGSALPNCNMLILFAADQQKLKHPTCLKKSQENFERKPWETLDSSFFWLNISYQVVLSFFHQCGCFSVIVVLSAVGAWLLMLKKGLFTFCIQVEP